MIYEGLRAVEAAVENYLSSHHGEAVMASLQSFEENLKRAVAQVTSAECSYTANLGYYIQAKLRYQRSLIQNDFGPPWDKLFITPTDSNIWFQTMERFHAAMYRSPCQSVHCNACSKRKKPWPDTASRKPGWRLT